MPLASNVIRKKVLCSAEKSSVIWAEPHTQFGRSLDRMVKLHNSTFNFSTVHMKRQDCMQFFNHSTFLLEIKANWISWYLISCQERCIRLGETSYFTNHNSFLKIWKNSLVICICRSENIMAGKKYVVGSSESRKSSLIQKILPTQFSLDEDQEFSNIGPENNSGKNFIF